MRGSKTDFVRRGDGQRETMNYEFDHVSYCLILGYMSDESNSLL